jgi:hypothetical protein
LKENELPKSKGEPCYQLMHCAVNSMPSAKYLSRASIWSIGYPPHASQTKKIYTLRYIGMTISSLTPNQKDPEAYIGSNCKRNKDITLQ